MSDNKKLFLSAVSSEFEAYRQLLAADLKRPELDVAVQEDFIVSGASTLEKLDTYIQHCQGVVHLIGKATGTQPEASAVQALLEQHPDLGERLPALADSLRQPDQGFSYTQWEAYLAIYHDREVFIYCPTDFDKSDLDCPREDRFVYDPAEEQSQQDHYRRICALGRDRGRFLNPERLSSAVLRDLVEILPRLETSLDVPPTRLRHTAERLIGRDTELTMLDAAWNDAQISVVVVRGKGGEGKTSLVATWMAELALKRWRGAENVFDWSFYSQGTRDQNAASAETFINQALQYFGDPDPNQGSAHERGARLAGLVGQRRCLLVLDGLEPLQYAPGPMHGRLKDPGMAALLKGLVARNDGLCVLTTREKVDEIKQHYGRSAVDHDLEFLTPAAGAALLFFAGAQRAGEKAILADDPELQQASQEVKGHALTLFLLGQYLRLTEEGDIRRRDQMKLAEAEAEYKNDATRPYGHAFKAIAAYQIWFAAGDDQAKRQLALLGVLGLFDRPASRACLTALRDKPTIPGLNEAFVEAPEKDWQLALGRLQEIKLIHVQDDGSVDCHPLFRAYFAHVLRKDNPEALRAGHQRLYQHLCETKTDKKPNPTLDDLQPLYQAVSHGCQAGLYEETRSKVYHDRLLRGTGDDGFYSWRKLGAFGSNLGALACFFDTPWSCLSPSLTEPAQAWLLNETAIQLRALGRLTEALEPMRVGLEMRIKQQVWDEAARYASNLSELELTLGLLKPSVLSGVDVAGAVGDGELSVTYADRSGDAFLRSVNRVTHADALHQAGRRDEAEARFCEAEQMQAEDQPEYPLLYGLAGFRHCELLLAKAESAAGSIDEGTTSSSDSDRHEGLEACFSAEQRAAQTLQWAERNNFSLLAIALDHLTLGRAVLYEAILNGSPLATSHSSLETAVNGLRRAGQQDELPRGLLTRAWCSCAEATEHRLNGNEQGAAECLVRAQRDLHEAWEIAERGSMKLHMADIHLYRARLFGKMKDEIPYPWESPFADLDAAAKLIEETGYHRRDEELADLREAAKDWAEN